MKHGPMTIDNMVISSNGSTPKSSMYRWEFLVSTIRFGIPTFMETSIWLTRDKRTYWDQNIEGIWWDYPSRKKPEIFAGSAKQMDVTSNWNTHLGIFEISDRAFFKGITLHVMIFLLSMFWCAIYELNQNIDNKNHHIFLMCRSR